MRHLIAIGVVMSLTLAASGDIVISEWMYSGTNGEFIEFTNTGPASVDMSGWSFDDSSQIPGTVDLSAFGVVNSGESVILTEAVAADFATAWGLTGVDIIGELAANLGRDDQINLYDAGDTLIDQLAFGDETYPGTPRTQNASCNVPDTDYGDTVAQTDWTLATVGDSFGSWMSAGGDIASPGRIVGYAASDLDEDGDVDLDDFAVFNACITGPDVSYDPLPAGCTLTPDAEGFLAVDYDEDGDLDMSDYVAVFQVCVSGAGEPADPSCGHDSGETPGGANIILNGSSITVEGSGVTVDGTTATITSYGTYNITGTLSDGQIVVNAASGGFVEMVLNGVNITNSTNAPIYVMNAGDVEVILPDQTNNYLYDATTYVYEDPEEDEPNAALFSKDTMLISGSGSLTVHGNYNDAITSKDELTITGGTITVIAADDGIRGKDYLLIQDGDITVTAEGDALKSDNDEDAELGYIAIEGGTFSITSGGDGLAAETDVLITGGDFDITSGGGHNATLPEDVSAKGIKGLVSVVIGGGTFTLDCADDGIHSNADVTINTGTLTIATGDDAVHADELVEINGGTIIVTDSYEGIEGADVTINDGTIRVTSSDDGINGAGGDGSGGPPPPPPGDHTLYINGGYIAVYADGDGIDVNGDIVMTGGTVIVHGPTGDMNGALDYDGTFNISGGFLVAAGSAGMAEAPSSSSSQRSVKITYSQWKSAGTLAHIETTSGGSEIVTFAPSKMYRSLVVSSPDLVSGTSYDLYRAGSSTGTVTDGLYQGGTYSPGTKTNTFTTYSIVTNVNAQ